MNRRLLAISWEMPPLSGPRAIQVSRTLAALARRGWSSTAIAVDPRPGGPLMRDTAGAPPFASAGVDVLRVPSPEETWPYRAAMRLFPALARRPDRHRGWLPAAVECAERQLKTGKYRCVVTFAQPWTDHLIGLRLRRDTNTPWVAHFSDPWADSPYLAAGARPAALDFESAVVGDADALVFVTRQTADVVMAKYPPAHHAKAHVIPHGFDRAVLGEPPGAPARGERLKMVYTGRFYDRIRTPEILLSAISRFVHRDDLQLVLMGPDMTRYATTVRRFGIERLVDLRDAAPYHAALREAGSADVLVAVDSAADGGGMFLPSKLIDYLMFRKPILGITPEGGASAALLHRLGFQTAAPDDRDGIAAAIQRLLDAWEGGALRVPGQFDAVAAEYDIERTSAAFAAVLDRWR